MWLTVLVRTFSIFCSRENVRRVSRLVEKSGSAGLALLHLQLIRSAVWVMRVHRPYTFPGHKPIIQGLRCRDTATDNHK